jgi:hypothetical protein
MLDSSNKGNQCASAHALGKNIVQGSPFAIHADLDIGRQQELAVVWTGKVAALIAIADQGYGLSQSSLHSSEYKRQLQRLIQFAG